MTNTSPLFRLLDEDGNHFYCETDRCGSNFFMFDDEDGWICNSCKEEPVIKPGSLFRRIQGEGVTVTKNKVKVIY